MSREIDDLILEGIVTTRNPDGSINVAPMGPEVKEGAFSKLILKPFKTSTTFQNLARHGEGVFHVVDNVLLLAEAMTETRTPELTATDHIAGARLIDCCRYYEFKVTHIDDSNDRSRIETSVVHSGRVRDFYGLNRAKNAVIEAAILVSRVGLIPSRQIKEELEQLSVIVGKTGGPNETQAMEILSRHLDLKSFVAPTVLRVHAPSRLHVGFFSIGGEDFSRAYGGVGLMIDEPAVELIGRAPFPPDRNSVIGEGIATNIIDRVSRIRNEVASRLHLEPEQTPSIEIIASPAEHVGLGVGTQLSLSVAKIVSHFAGQQSISLDELTRMTHRGRRSAIGIHGWKSGGFLVDSGKSQPNEIGRPVVNRQLPPQWKVLVIQPPLPLGKHGEVEEKAINTQVNMPAETTHHLCEIVLLHMLPAIEEKDIDSFGRALRDYNRLVGNCFASVQGGPYAHPMIEAMIDWLGQRKVGGAQSSWGPTTFAVMEGDESAHQLGHDLAKAFDLTDHQWRVTSVSISGVKIQS